jgi:hypothetical protein
VVLLGVPSALAMMKGADPFLVGCLIPVVPLILDLVLFPRLLRFADRQYGGGLEMEN